MAGTSSQWSEWKWSHQHQSQYRDRVNTSTGETEYQWEGPRTTHGMEGQVSDRNMTTYAPRVAALARSPRSSTTLPGQSYQTVPQYTYQRPEQHYLAYSQPQQTPMQQYGAYTATQNAEQPWLQEHATLTTRPSGSGSRRDGRSGGGHRRSNLTTGEIPAQTFQGVPNTGSKGKLDPSYEMKSPGFFVQGKVFAMLHTEACSQNLPVGDDRVSIVKYGELAFSSIRRFVVVDKREHFCYCVPIATYGGQATTKRNINASHHAVIYTSSEPPRLLDGEGGINKQAIGVNTGRRDIWLDTTSRVNFGIVHPVQYNVKVKDLGQVISGDMPNLIAYYRMELNR